MLGKSRICKRSRLQKVQVSVLIRNPNGGCGRETAGEPSAVLDIDRFPSHPALPAAAAIPGKILEALHCITTKTEHPFAISHYLPSMGVNTNLQVCPFGLAEII